MNDLKRLIDKCKLFNICKKYLVFVRDEFFLKICLLKFGIIINKNRTNIKFISYKRGRRPIFGKKLQTGMIWRVQKRHKTDYRDKQAARSSFRRHHHHHYSLNIHT